MSKIQKLIERLVEVLSTCREILEENRYSKKLCRKMSEDALKKCLNMRGRKYLLTLDRNFNLIRKHE